MSNDQYPQSQPQPSANPSWEDTGWIPTQDPGAGGASQQQWGEPQQSANQWPSSAASASWAGEQWQASAQSNEPQQSQQTQQWQSSGASAQGWQQPQGQGVQLSPVQQQSTAAGGGGLGGFFGALFDFSFNRFVTPSIVKFLYILTVVFTALYWLGGTLVLFMMGSAAGEYDDSGDVFTMLGVLNLLFGWIPALVTIGLARMQYEFMMASVRTSEDVHLIKAKLDA